MNNGHVDKQTYGHGRLNIWTTLDPLAHERHHHLDHLDHQLDHILRQLDLDHMKTTIRKKSLRS